METVQQTVVHRDHGIPVQPSMAYAQRSTQLHRANQAGEVIPFKQRPSASPIQSQQVNPSVRTAPPQAPSGTYSSYAPPAQPPPPQPPPPRPSPQPSASQGSAPSQRGSPQHTRPQLSGTSRFPNAGPPDGHHPIYQQQRYRVRQDRLPIPSFDPDLFRGSPSSEPSSPEPSFSVVIPIPSRENAGNVPTSESSKGAEAGPGPGAGPGSGAGPGPGAGPRPGSAGVGSGPGSVMGLNQELQLRDNFYKSLLTNTGLANRVPLPAKSIADDPIADIHRAMNRQVVNWGIGGPVPAELWESHLGVRVAWPTASPPTDAPSIVVPFSPVASGAADGHLRKSPDALSPVLMAASRGHSGMPDGASASGDRASSPAVWPKEKYSKGETNYSFSETNKPVYYEFRQTGVPPTGVPQTGVPPTGVPPTGVPPTGEAPPTEAHEFKRPVKDDPPPGNPPVISATPVDYVPPLKKARLNKPDLMQSKNTSREPTYTPQVEAISPTPEMDETCLRFVKDQLLGQISRVDREINNAEAYLALLQRKERELESNHGIAEIYPKEEAIVVPKHRNLAQKIYAENRRRAQEAHATLDKLGPPVDYPMYNQPSDNEVYHENRRQYIKFKATLVEHLKKQHAQREEREKQMANTYSRLMQDWMRKVERIEASQKRKSKEARVREFFEKVFPGLRKAREDRERFNRVGARVKSEADYEEILDGLQEQEVTRRRSGGVLQELGQIVRKPFQNAQMEDKKMRAMAVVPPLLLDPSQRKLSYNNNNGRIEDYEREYKERQVLNVWTQNEKDIFREKFVLHPKNFGLIASYLDRKSVPDCVQYYYLSKKTENYRQLLRKSRRQQRLSRIAQAKLGTNSSNPGLPEIVSSGTGVTTRLQREQLQQQKQEQQQQPPQPPPPQAHPPQAHPPQAHPPQAHPPQAHPTQAHPTSTATVTESPRQTASPATTVSSATSSTPTLSATTMAVASSTETTTTTSSASVAGDQPPSLSPSRVEASPGPGATTASGAGAGAATASTASSANSKEPPTLHNDKEAFSPTAVPDTPKAKGEAKLESKKKERRKEEKKKKENEHPESSDEEMQEQDKAAGIHTCVVCHSQVEHPNLSRLLQRSHAAQYGLRDEDLVAGARVCNACRCKVVRSRYIHCPLPTCPNSKGRVKRVRPLPARWAELTAEQKEPVIAEFQIPPGVTKACSACFNRISRRISPTDGTGSGANTDSGAGASTGASDGASTTSTTASTTTSTTNTLRWTDEETESFKRALRELGTNWAKVSDALGGTKTHHQCKNYYFNYRKKLGLDALVQEYNKNHLGEERKPTLTDEEESGSTTSSCDEVSGNAPNDSDTASAASPTLGGESDPDTRAVLDAEPKTGRLSPTPASPQPPVILLMGKLGNLISSPASSGTPSVAGVAASPGVAAPPNVAVPGVPATGVAVPGVPVAPGVPVVPVLPGAPLVPGAPGSSSNSNSSPSSGPVAMSGPPTAAPGATQTRTTSESSDQMRPGNKEDYDSSATETADEGQGGADAEGTVPATATGAPAGAPAGTPAGTPAVAPTVAPTGPPTGAPATAAPPPAAAPANPPSEANGPSSPITMEDIMGGIIEMQLKKTPNATGQSPALGQPPNTADRPTISSILNTDSPVGAVGNRGYRVSISDHNVRMSPGLSGSKQPLPVMKMPYHTPPGAVDGPVSLANNELPKEGLVLQVTQAMREQQDQTLDLSIKRPRESAPPISPYPNRNPSPSVSHALGSTHHLTSHPLPAHGFKSHGGATSTPPPPIGHHGMPAGRDGAYYHHQSAPVSEPGRPLAKSPSVYVTAVPHQPNAPQPHHLAPRQNQPSPQQHNKPLAKVPQPQASASKLSPKIVSGSTAKGGSITHGTPVSGARYDAVPLRQTPASHPGPHVPQAKETGSITQGTPLHLVRCINRSPTTPFEFYKVVPAGGAPAPHNAQPPAMYPYQPTTPVTTSSGGFTSPYPHQAARPAAYAIEQRQIIMNDYITSQQMHSRRGPDKPGETPRSSPGYYSPHATPTNVVVSNSSPAPVSVGQNAQPSPIPSGHSAAASPYMYSSDISRTKRPPSLQPPERTPPPPALPQQQARQGVIQRHNTTPQPQPAAPPQTSQAPPSQLPPRPAPTHYAHPPPGHEAFSSLVDVAVQQPSLPVPHVTHSVHSMSKDSDKRQHHEGLGKTMADSLTVNEQRMREREQQDRKTQREVEMQHQELQRQHILLQQRQQQQQHDQRKLIHHYDMMQQHQQQQQQVRLAMAIDMYQQQQIAAANFSRESPQQTTSQQHPTHSPSPVDSRQSHREPSQSVPGRPSIGNSATSLPAPPQTSGTSTTSGGGAPGSSGGGGGGNSGSATSKADGDTALTAATLINAIITHTFNQSSTEGGPGGQQGSSAGGAQASRPGDRLFPDFHREQPSGRTGSAHEQAKPNPPSDSSGNSSQAAPVNTSNKNLTLSEHIDSIISEDLSSNNAVSSYHQHGHPPRSVAYPYHLAGPPSTVPPSQVIDDHGSWKPRRIVDKPGPGGTNPANQGQGPPGAPQGSQGAAQDERTNIRIIQPPSPRKILFQVEPVSPPDSASVNVSTASSHHWLPGGAAGTPVSVPTSVVGGLSVPSAGAAPDHMAFLPRRYYPDPKQLSPLEYVNNKIVEVMRTSEDDKDSRNKGDEGRSEKEARNSPGDLVMEDGRSATPAEKASPQPAASQPAPQQSPYAPSTTYAYPFSALSVPQTGGATSAAVAKAPGATASILSKTSEADSARQQEPKPILSAQYEPLSDSD